jgi:hypothetical protein
MNEEVEGHPGADVRSFLPWPGEPVEDYAERLRSLHRDLTLVLQAVERGLAAAATAATAASEAGEAERQEPQAVVAPGGPAPLANGPSAPSARPPVETPSAGPRPRQPRVEVIPAASGERRRADSPEERHEAVPWSEPPRATVESPPTGPPEPPGRLEPPEPTATQARPAGSPALPTPSLPSRPSHAVPEPAWVERPTPPEAFTPPTFPAESARPPREMPPRLVLLVAATGWVIVVALVAVLLLA